ncbi:MAG: GntR family transcriptional regulator [Proteobacteria bacterium]|nr:GntR family transcriptional regulator [Pseudomonadota bacterium]MBU4472000.1 GntR family transcriptional regulator [Pseudomonadota bacterium]MCG2753000.1 GntR family transcriptional regulator [Desulfobacteraceae bacterium]
MLLIHLDRQSRTPLFRQIFGQLKSMIEENVLRPGDRLPSSRSLSDVLGINRTSVTKAYEELWAMGYTDSRSGSYSLVRQRADIGVGVDLCVCPSMVLRPPG